MSSLEEGNTVAVREDDIRPLSVPEERRLAQLEQVVIKGARTFIEVGNALIEIRDRELYRPYRTFERYCKRIFDLSKPRAYQLIDASLVIDLVKNSTIVESGAEVKKSTIVDADNNDVIEMLPINEAQIRPLVQLKGRPDQLREVWQAAVRTAPNGKITASHINKIVKGYLGEVVTSRIRVARDQVDSSMLLGADFKRAFDAFMDQIDAARKSGYKTTSRGNIVTHLDQLRAIIAEDGATIAEPEYSGGHQNANKLERAGYRLFRMDESRMAIKERAGGGWPSHSGPYQTKTAMQAAWAELMKDATNLAG